MIATGRASFRNHGRENMTHRLIGGSLLKLTELYSEGELTREDVILALKEWEYEGDPARTDLDRNEDGEPLRGTFAEVEEAYYIGFIDSDIYDEIVEFVLS
jgi:hypothetical protein